MDAAKTGSTCWVTRIAAILVMALAATLTACGGDAAPEHDPIPPAQPPAYDANRFAEVQALAWRSYLRLQDALAYDRYDEAHAAATALQAAAGTELAPLATAAATAADIAGLRIAFDPLSEAMIERGAPAGFAVAYCPMAFDYQGARWVQAKGYLMNPYFGSRMLRCGAFEDEPAAAAQTHRDQTP